MLENCEENHQQREIYRAKQWPHQHVVCQMLTNNTLERELIITTGLYVRV